MINLILFKSGMLLKCIGPASLFSHKTKSLGMTNIKPGEVITILEYENTDNHGFSTYKVLYDNKIFYFDYCGFSWEEFKIDG
jgi:hypothetical protein